MNFDFFPLHEFAFGFVGTALGVAGLFGDVVQFVDRDRSAERFEGVAMRRMIAAFGPRRRRIFLILACRGAGGLQRRRRDGKNSNRDFPVVLFGRFEQHRFQNSMDYQVGIAADGRGEMRVTWCRQREVAEIFFRVARLLERAQHQVTQDALFRLARDFGGQLLVHARSDVHFLGNFDGAGLFAGAARGAAVALELHALNRQRTHAERISECRRDHFEIVNALGVGLFVNSI